MQKVLENRPYHYDQWMVILQKWEPVISDTFPSKIPFWIEVLGLPKHFWQPKMLQTIGDELGETLDMEITPAAAKIQLLIDGLQPLTKETMVDFPDGSEALITLEYKNLKNHCLHCLRLTHEKKDCPGLRKEKENIKTSNPTEYPVASREGSRNYYVPSDNFVAPRKHSGISESHTYSQAYHNPLKRKPDSEGDRAISHSEGRSRNHHYVALRNSTRVSPDHRGRTLNRGYKDHHLQRREGRYASRTNLQWREKTPTDSGSHHETTASSRSRRPPLERTNTPMDPIHSLFSPRNLLSNRSSSPGNLPSPPPAPPTREQVMGELREVTV